MKITCLDREIRNVLGTGYYHVPRFQRPYSWEWDHIVDFWNDTIIECESDYFIGPMVIFKGNIDVFDIVDGQQRLTTITMILCALRNAYRKEGLEPLARGVHSLIERIGLDSEHRFILQTETSYPYFQEHIQKYDVPDIEAEYNSEEINLKNAFELINRLIQEEISYIRQLRHVKKDEVLDIIKERLSEIRDKVLKLKVILVEVVDEDDAYIIFETLNTRGKDLNVSDLVKNHLIKSIKVSNRQVDLPKDKWKQIRENIDSISAEIDIDTFLLHVWLSKYEHTTVKTLYKKFKLTIKKYEFKTFLDLLVNDSEIYKSIFDPESRRWEKNEIDIKKILINLNNFRVTQQTPMVLAVLRGYLSGKLKYKLTLEALEAIEKFHYLFTAITSQRSSGGIASMYSSHARKLTNAKEESAKSRVIRELKQKMREKIPTVDEFHAGFKKLRFTSDFTKQKKIIFYTLSKIDSYYSQHGLIVDYEFMTIEHIHAQNARTKNENVDVPVGQIGNLMLIDKRTNESLGNKDFVMKQKVFGQTKIFTDGIVANATKWDREEIEKRTDYLGKVAYECIFKI